MSAKKIDDGLDRQSRNYQVGYSNGYQAGKRERPESKLETELATFRKLLENADKREKSLLKQIEESSGKREKSYAQRAERAEGMFDDLLDMIWRAAPDHMRDQIIIAYPHHVVASILRLKELDALYLYNEKRAKA